MLLDRILDKGLDKLFDILDKIAKGLKLDKIAKGLKETNYRELAKKYKYTIICVIYFIVIVSFQGSVHLKNVLNIFTIFLIMGILARVKYTLPLQIVFFISICFDAFFAFVYHDLINVSIMTSIMETNPREAISMLKDAFIPAILVIVVSGFVFFASIRELKDNKISWSFSLIIIGVFYLIVMPLHVNDKINRYKNDKREDYTYDSTLLLDIQRYASPRASLVVGNWLTLALYFSVKDHSESFGVTERALPEGVTFAVRDSIPEKIFIVIGESSWRKHYSLYGYERPTTPFLDELRDADESNLVYKDGLSIAAVTCFAVPMGMSFCTASDRKPFVDKMNIVDIVKKAGYQTYWFSAQEPLIFNQNDVNRLAAVAEDLRYLKGLNVQDLDLLQYVNETIEPGKKQCFFLHTSGSHGPVKDRYTEEDNVAGLIGNSPVDDYDRSLHYTDRFLQGVNNIAVSNGNSLIYYFSDHGETINKGHGFIHTGIDQYETPIFAINHSKIPTDSINSIMGKYMNNDAPLLNTCNNIYVVAEIIGCKVSDSTIKRAKDNGRFVYHADLYARTVQEVEELKR